MRKIAFSDLQKFEKISEVDTRITFPRREVRRLFNRCRADNNSSGWEFYREDRRTYRNKVRNASKETWSTFCSSNNNLPRLSRLHSALSRDRKTRLGSVVARTGTFMQHEGETLDILLATHSPTQLLWKGLW